MRAQPQGPHLQMPSHWGLVFNIGIWGNRNFQPLALAKTSQEPAAVGSPSDAEQSRGSMKGVLGAANRHRPASGLSHLTPPPPLLWPQWGLEKKVPEGIAGPSRTPETAELDLTEGRPSSRCHLSLSVSFPYCHTAASVWAQNNNQGAADAIGQGPETQQ